MADNKRNPKGYFKYILAIDCETTGYKQGRDPSIGHQAISWGIIVADAHTLLPIEKLYVEIKWNDESLEARNQDPTFSVGAANIHGLTFDYLEKNGITEEDAVIQIAELIMKYWGPTNQLHCLGHNIHFDVSFLYAMFKRFNIDLRFSARQLDSNSMGFIVVESFTSDSMFDTMGFPPRDSHNALQDIEQTLESCRRMRVLSKDFIGLDANES